MHLDEEQLQRLLHGEFAPVAGGSLRKHVSSCAECRERLRDAERDEGEIHALLRLVDHPAPAVRAGAVVARAARGGVGGRGRWAAGIMLALSVAGVAYAMPGSPLRDWVREVRQPADERSQPEPLPAPEMAGLSMAPGKAFTILFESADPEGRVRVSLGDWTEVRVRAAVGAATFTSDGGRLAIANRPGAAAFEIDIPRDAPRVEIRVKGDRIFLKDGSRLLPESLEDMGEPHLLPLSAPNR